MVAQGLVGGSAVWNVMGEGGLFKCRAMLDMSKQGDIELPKMGEQSFIIPIIEVLRMDRLRKCTFFQCVAAQMLRSTLTCT